MVHTYGRRQVSGRWLDAAVWVILAAVAYVPSFLTQPGKTRPTPSSTSTSTRAA